MNRQEKNLLEVASGGDCRYAVLCDMGNARGLFGVTDSLTEAVEWKNAIIDRCPAIYERQGKKWKLIAYEGRKP